MNKRLSDRAIDILQILDMELDGSRESPAWDALIKYIRELEAENRDLKSSLSAIVDLPSNADQARGRILLALNDFVRFHETVTGRAKAEILAAPIEEDESHSG